MFRRTAPFAAAALIIAALTGCSSAATPATTGTESAPAPAGEPLHVFAAASLQQPFEALMADFAAEHPEVQFAPLEAAGSQKLVTQILEGAKADVVALASEGAAEPLSEMNLPFQIFTTNTLTIAVAPGNPLGITGLADLADHRVALCTPEAPCGAATEKLLAANNLTLPNASEEQDVAATLAKLTTGEVDAAIVYTSDTAANPDTTEAVAAEGADQIVNRYPIAAISTGPAQDFVDFVRGEHGQEVLAKFGFTAP